MPEIDQTYIDILTEVFSEKELSKYPDGYKLIEQKVFGSNERLICSSLDAAKLIQDIFRRNGKLFYIDSHARDESKELFDKEITFLSSYPNIVQDSFISGYEHARVEESNKWSDEAYKMKKKQESARHYNRVNLIFFILYSAICLYFQAPILIALYLVPASILGYKYYLTHDAYETIRRGERQNPHSEYHGRREYPNTTHI